MFQLCGPTSSVALKVFKPRFRVPLLATQSERLARYATLPGLTVACRTVLTLSRYPDLLRTYPDLTYAVVMPWISGPTWYDLVLERQPLAAATSLALARRLLTVLMMMEETENQD